MTGKLKRERVLNIQHTESEQQHAVITSVLILVILHCQKQVSNICFAAIIIRRREMA
jgi:hypothetical protein